MGVEIRTTGALPTRCWDVQASREVGLSVRTIVVNRTFRQGRGLSDAPHKPYSTRPMTVAMGNGGGTRLAPKGGKPAYGRGHPRRLLTAKGNARKAQGWQITGRYYEGGYAEYKASSRKGRGADPNPSGAPKLPTSPGGTAAVDLILTGRMERGFQLLDWSVDRVVVGIDPASESASYAPHTHAARAWIGLSPADQKIIGQVLNEPGIVGPTGQPRGIVARAMERSRLRAEARLQP